MRRRNWLLAAALCCLWLHAASGDSSGVAWVSVVEDGALQTPDWLLRAWQATVLEGSNGLSVTFDSDDGSVALDAGEPRSSIILVRLAIFQPADAPLRLQLASRAERRTSGSLDLSTYGGVSGGDGNWTELSVGIDALALGSSGDDTAWDSLVFQVRPRAFCLCAALS